MQPHTKSKKEKNIPNSNQMTARQFMRKLFIRMRLRHDPEARYFRARAHRDNDYKKLLSLSFPRALFYFLFGKHAPASIRIPLRGGGLLQFRKTIFKCHFEKGTIV